MIGRRGFLASLAVLFSATLAAVLYVFLRSRGGGVGPSAGAGLASGSGPSAGGGPTGTGGTSAGGGLSDGNGPPAGRAPDSRTVSNLVAAYDRSLALEARRLAFAAVADAEGFRDTAALFRAAARADAIHAALFAERLAAAGKTPPGRMPPEEARHGETQPGKTGKAPREEPAKSAPEGKPGEMPGGVLQETQTTKPGGMPLDPAGGVPGAGEMPREMSGVGETPREISGEAVGKPSGGGRTAAAPPGGLGAAARIAGCPEVQPQPTGGADAAPPPRTPGNLRSCIEENIRLHDTVYADFLKTA
ncbi:MAG: hypothetical protein N3A38_17235, partial [Planctomycetota bacterium]|nr:hypothetical protein [Planctomycetota bacterium]